jgi:predicted RNase H-like HicB family nuclease
MTEYTIAFTWDDDAGVWIAESPGIPGLILESGSFDALVERVKAAVPELLDMAGKEHAARLRFTAERQAVVA